MAGKYRARHSARLPGAGRVQSGRAGTLQSVPALLRDFLYLDDRLTSQYLAQLEGGIYEEEFQSATTGRNRGAEAGAKVGPLNAGGSRGQNAEVSRTRTMHQTPEGDFRRLEKLLDDEEGLQWLEAFDDEIWNELERGETLRIESVLEISSIYQASEMASSVGPLVALMETVGETVDAETQEAISGMTRFSEALKDIPVVAHAAGAPKYKFICPLKRDYLREDLGALAGECIVVGSLQRRLKPTERYSILDSLGASGLPRAQRRQAERDIKKGASDLVIRAPAALLTPLAIYR